MCGIVGIISFKSPIDKSSIDAMNSAQFHRGPDDGGTFFDQHVAFGFRRLSILDLSNFGHQPMQSYDGRYILVFNGEIYNYKSIRAILVNKGYKFKSNSDSEVVLNSYIEWGQRCLEKFQGMFSIAVYDKMNSNVFIARDRLGVKPLYYSVVKGRVIFASEVKSLLAYPGLERQVNMEAISSYLTFRYPYSDLSVFEGIFRLTPGHFANININGMKISQYWQLPYFKERDKEDLGENFYLEKVESLLESAVSKRLISDVPLGALLSGGLDSSLIVAMMAKKTNNLRTYSIGFNNEGYDEYKFAKIVSDYFGTNHHSLNLTEEEYFSQLTTTIVQKDAPLSIPHEIALLNISKELKKHTTVVISGEGADELFGGYGRVQRSPMDYKKISFIRNYFPRNSHHTLFKLFGAKSHSSQWLKSSSEAEHFFSVYNWMPFEEKWSLFSEDTMNTINHDRKNIDFWVSDFQKLEGVSFYDKILYLFEKNHLTCLLDRLDSMSMAASVEARVPFVDHELVEFVSKIPIHYKLKWKSKFHKYRAIFRNSFEASEQMDDSKYLLRKLGQKILPKEIPNRKKTGFPVPLDSWINSGMIKYTKEILLDDKSKSRGLYNFKKLEKLLNHKQNLDYDFWGKKVWMMLNIEIWHQEFIDK